MKQVALGAALAVALIVPAFAADMPLKAVRPASAAASVSWTGCYVGGGGGYGQYYQENTGYAEGPPRFQVTDTFSTGGKGWFGTVQAGCDYQFNAGPWSIVVGGFGDYDFADIKGRRFGAFIQGAGVGSETLTDGPMGCRWPHRCFGPSPIARVFLGGLY